MREKSQKKQPGLKSTSTADGYFLIVRNYRQWLIKKHRKMLRKQKDEHRRMMQMDEIESDSPIVVESSPHMDFYYSDQPWDILNDDSARLKSNRSSTHTLDQHELNEEEDRRRERTGLFGIGCVAKTAIFCNSFLPFAFQQQKGEFVTN